MVHENFEKPNTAAQPEDALATVLRQVRQDAYKDGHKVDYQTFLQKMHNDKDLNKAIAALPDLTINDIKGITTDGNGVLISKHGAHTEKSGRYSTENLLAIDMQKHAHAVERDSKGLHIKEEHRQPVPPENRQPQTEIHQQPQYRMAPDVQPMAQPYAMMNQPYPQPYATFNQPFIPAQNSNDAIALAAVSTLAAVEGIALLTRPNPVVNNYYYNAPHFRYRWR